MNSAPPSSPVVEGEVIDGKYRVDRVLGLGGMGIVVAATHVHLEQRVALKFLLPSAMSHLDVIQRFLREARAAVKIQSEHVAKVLDVGTLSTGAPYMVMEYLEGEDLEQVIARLGPQSEEDAVDYVLEACEAVAEAHSYGIVHRDLKPANLFLANRPNGRPVVKVLDFGISKSLYSTADAALTKTSAIMGSPLYMSPEQMASARQADVRSDIWSLGIILYELLTQQLPFKADTMPELVLAVVHRPPDPIRARREDVSPGLEDVVLRCLEKDPNRRFGDVAELASALAPFGRGNADDVVGRISASLLGRTSSPRVSQVPQPKAPSVASSSYTTAPWAQSDGPTLVTAPEPTVRRRSRAMLVGAIGAAAALLLGLVTVTARHGAPAPVASASAAGTTAETQSTPAAAPEPIVEVRAAPPPTGEPESPARPSVAPPPVPRPSTATRPSPAIRTASPGPAPSVSVAPPPRPSPPVHPSNPLDLKLQN